MSHPFQGCSVFAHSEASGRDAETITVWMTCTPNYKNNCTLSSQITLKYSLKQNFSGISNPGFLFFIYSCFFQSFQCVACSRAHPSEAAMEPSHGQPFKVSDFSPNKWGSKLLRLWKTIIKDIKRQNMAKHGKPEALLKNSSVSDNQLLRSLGDLNWNLFCSHEHFFLVMAKWLYQTDRCRRRSTTSVQVPGLSLSFALPKLPVKKSWPQWWWFPWWDLQERHKLDEIHGRNENN